MIKTKIKKKKGFLRPIHFQALLFTLAYYGISKFVFIESVANKNLLISFIGPFSFGVVSCLVFLYLFSHEDFFHFIKSLEKKENGKEKKFLKKYYHHSRIFASILIGVIGGTLFLALTVRFLINRFSYKYIVIVVASFLSTLVSVGIAKGFLSLVF